MFEDEPEFLPPKEEEVPARLAKKWDEREKREGLKACSACRKQILASSAFCPYCGKPLDAPDRAWIYLTAAVLLAGVIITGIRFLI